MQYRDGYKYQLAASEIFKTSLRPVKNIETEFIFLETDGTMTVKRGYAWDGATGAIDRKSNRRASCGHDAMYQLMRLGLISKGNWKRADDDYCRWMKERGAWGVTIAAHRKALEWAGGRFADPKNRKKVYTA